MFALCLDRIVQQEPITAAHHLDAVGDKAASLVLARIDLEILLGAAEVEQDFGNGAIAFTAQAGVQRAQGKDVPLPERKSRPGRWPCSAFTRRFAAWERRS